MGSNDTLRLMGRFGDKLCGQSASLMLPPGEYNKRDSVYCQITLVLVVFECLALLLCSVSVRLVSLC